MFNIQKASKCEDYAPYIMVDGRIFDVRTRVIEFIKENGVTSFGMELSENCISLECTKNGFAIYSGKVILCTSDLKELFGYVPKIIYYV